MHLAQVAQAGVQAALASFEKKWKVSSLKAGTGRAACPVKDPLVAAAVQKVLTEPSLSADLIPTDGQTDLASVLAPALFAVAAGSDHCYRETDSLPTLRLCCSGTRQVVLVPIESAWSAVCSSNQPLQSLQGGTAPTESIDMGQLCHTLLTSRHLRSQLHFASALRSQVHWDQAMCCTRLLDGL